MGVPETRVGLRGAAPRRFMAARYNVGVTIMVKRSDAHARCSMGQRHARCYDADRVFPLSSSSCFFSFSAVTLVSFHPADGTHLNEMGWDGMGIF